MTVPREAWYLPPRNKTPKQALLSADGTFLILVEACFKPSGRDAEATPKSNLVDYLPPGHTRPTKCARSTLQPSTIAPAMTHFMGVLRTQPRLPTIYDSPVH